MTNIVLTLLKVKVDLFDNEFALLVLLTTLICLSISPSNQCLASFTKDITHTVHSSDEESIFSRSGGDIDAMIKEIGSTMSPMEALGDDIVMTGKMGSTLPACVHTRSFKIHHGIVFGLCRF